MCQQQNITAVIYNKRGRIIAIGKNSYIKTHPLQAKYANRVNEKERIYLHAEIAALVKLKDWSEAYKIVVVRLNRAGVPVSAKPCPGCQLAIREAGIKVVEHS
jgi:deoxycytidylate deaminase